MDQCGDFRLIDTQNLRSGFSPAGRNASGGYLDIINAAGGHRYCLTILPHAFEMKLDGFTNELLHLRNGRARGDAAGQIRNVGGVVVAGLLDHDGVAHGGHLPFQSPDCLRILFSVPGANSAALN